MKKKQYICPEITEIQVDMESHLAAGSAERTDVEVNQEDVFDGVFRAPRQPNVWGEDEE